MNKITIYHIQTLQYRTNTDENEQTQWYNEEWWYNEEPEERKLKKIPAHI